MPSLILSVKVPWSRHHFWAYRGQNLAWMIDNQTNAWRKTIK